MKITHQYKTFEKHNIIVDLLKHTDLTTNDIKLFMPLSNFIKKLKNRLLSLLLILIIMQFSKTDCSSVFIGSMT
jgi:hypothetical protein